VIDGDDAPQASRARAQVPKNQALAAMLIGSFVLPVLHRYNGEDWSR
jgi:hypothetical protein